MDDQSTLLTYEDAAKRLGIKTESLRKRAIRKGWAKTKGNDGKARIAIPNDLLKSKTKPVISVKMSDLMEKERRDMSRDMSQHEIALLKQKVEHLEASVSELKADRDEWRAQAKALAERQAEPQKSLLDRLLGR